jgi:hypothetical protein
VTQLEHPACPHTPATNARTHVFSRPEPLAPVLLTCRRHASSSSPSSRLRPQTTDEDRAVPDPRCPPRRIPRVHRASGPHSPTIRGQQPPGRPPLRRVPRGFHQGLVPGLQGRSPGPIELHVTLHLFCPLCTAGAFPTQRWVVIHVPTRIVQAMGADSDRDLGGTRRWNGGEPRHQAGFPCASRAAQTS